MNVRLIIPDPVDEGTTHFPVKTVNGYLRTIADIAGGYTSYRGQGGWIDSKGLLVEEPITIVDCFVADSLTINGNNHVVRAFWELARTIAQELSQECVFLSIDGKAEFIKP